MTKKLQKTIVLTAGMLCISGSSSVLASDAELEELKQQMQKIIYQNQQLARKNQELTKRISDIEKAMQAKGTAQETDDVTSSDVASSPVPERLLRTKEQQAVRKEMRKQMEEEGLEQKINKYVTLFGLIEVEAGYGDDFEGNSFSEFNVATGQLGFDAQMSEWTVGHILAKYEGGEDSHDLFIDEANIWLGNYEKFPLLMTAGKFYMPFGSFETNMIQDPLTLEIGEINDYGAAVGFKVNGFYSAVYGYNGMQESAGSDTINGSGVKAGYDFENDDMLFNAGVSWVNNIADSGGISDAFDEAGLETIKDHVNGFGVYLIAGYGPISFIGEYVRAPDAFYGGALNPETGEVEGGEILFNDHGAKLEAWNTELAYSTELFGKETVFAIGYQGTSEAVGLGLHQARYNGSASMVLLPGTNLTIEYYHDQDYDTDDGGTDGSADVFTTQLGYGF